MTNPIRSGDLTVTTKKIGDTIQFMTKEVQRGHSSQFYYTFPNRPIDMTNDFTVSIWATGKVQIILNDNYTNNRVESDTETLGLLYKIWSNGQSRKDIRVGITNLNNSYPSITPRQPLNELVHYTITHSASTRTVNFYQNGGYKTTVTYPENKRMPNKGYLKVQAHFSGVNTVTGRNSSYTSPKPPWKYSHERNGNEPSIGGDIFHKMGPLHIFDSLKSDTEIKQLYESFSGVK